MGTTTQHAANASGTTRQSGASRQELHPIVHRNIQELCRRREREAARATWEQRIADTATAVTGSMGFVYVHLILFGLWIVANLGWIPGVEPWDTSFAVLAMVASVEAIFLSTFVLITQNRMAEAADKRADLDLQISLLSEHEISKLAVLISAMARQMGIETEADRDVEDVKQEVKPGAVLDRIESENR
jgi:uncharacterized membrane protein